MTKLSINTFLEDILNSLLEGNTLEARKKLTSLNDLIHDAEIEWEDSTITALYSQFLVGLCGFVERFSGNSDWEARVNSCLISHLWGNYFSLKLRQYNDGNRDPNSDLEEFGSLISQPGVQNILAKYKCDSEGTELTELIAILASKLPLNQGKDEVRLIPR